MPIKNEVDVCETVKGSDTKPSSIKKSQRASPEAACSEKQDILSAEVCIPFSFLLKRAALTLRQRVQVSPMGIFLPLWMVVKHQYVFSEGFIF